MTKSETTEPRDKDRPSKEDLFHRLLNKHRDGAFKALAQMMPLTQMREVSSEIFPKKVPDRVFQSIDWRDDPRYVFLDLTIEITPDDIYKMNTYRSWGMERVAARLPLPRKLNEPQERVHGVLLGMFAPRQEYLPLAQGFRVSLLSLQEGLALNLSLTDYLEVGSPFVLGHLSWLKHQQPLNEWLEHLRKAVQVFQEADDEDELAFLLGWGRVILPEGTEETFIKRALDEIIEEELRMSTSTVVKKILQAWDVPHEERTIIARVMEGLDEEQRKIMLAALEGLDEEQRKIMLITLDRLSAQQRTRLVRILEDPEKLERLLTLLDD